MQGGDAVEIEKRYRVEVGRPERAYVYLVGCGGTGSFLALHLARLAYHAKQRHGLAVHLVFADPDVVEEGNLGRQNFCPAEVGEPKAWRLMARYNQAFGLCIEARVGRFEEGMLAWMRYGSLEAGLHLIAGAVDNAGARRDVMEMVSLGDGRVWWLDGGNHAHSGQVLLGNRCDLERPEVSPMGFCSGLPAPGLQCPELLEDDPLTPGPSPQGERGVSCAELALADVQSLMVNQAVAGWMASYVSRLLLSHDLDVYATYFDLVSGSARSMGITSDGEIHDGE